MSRVDAGAAIVDAANASRVFDITGGTFILRFVTIGRGRGDAAVGTAAGEGLRGAAGTTIALESSTIQSSAATGTTGASGSASARAVYASTVSPGSTTIVAGNDAGDADPQLGARRQRRPDANPAACRDQPVAVLGPPARAFPRTPVGKRSSQQSSTRQNRRATALEVGTVSLAGAEPSQFAIVPDTTTCTPGARIASAPGRS